MGTPKPLLVTPLALIQIRAYLIGQFPNLRNEKFKPDSESTFDYNCIAWAANDVVKPWWPTRDPTQGYWPIEWRDELDEECFVEAFRKVGNYEACGDDFTLEDGYEKVALYLNSSRHPQHMARQLDSGYWTSKMGVEAWDIIHETVKGIEGTRYGEAAVALKRQVSAR